MKGWRWGILLFELFLFALILVLPQVDLPDFTFHSGTAPVVAKARVSGSPLLIAASVATAAGSTIQYRQEDSHRFRRVDPASPLSLLTLLCILLC